MVMAHARIACGDCFVDALKLEGSRKAGLYRTKIMMRMTTAIVRSIVAVAVIVVEAVVMAAGISVAVVMFLISIAAAVDGAMLPPHFRSMRCLVVTCAKVAPCSPTQRFAVWLEHSARKCAASGGRQDERRFMLYSLLSGFALLNMPCRVKKTSECAYWVQAFNPFEVSRCLVRLCPNQSRGKGMTKLWPGTVSICRAGPQSRLHRSYRPA